MGRDSRTTPGEIRSQGFPPYVNHVVLSGELQNDPRYQLLEQRRGKNKGKPLECVHFKLHVVRQWKGRPKQHLWYWIRVFGSIAATIHEHKKRGDYVIVVGELRQRRFIGRDGKPRWWDYIVASTVQFVYQMPKTFLRGHVLVPKDEYERMKVLTADPFEVPEEVAAQLDAENSLKDEDLD